MRVKPPAFQRDSVDLGRHGRSWQTLEAWEIEVGDTIPGKGIVESLWSGNSGKVTVRFIMSDSIVYGWDEKVQVFSKKQILTDGDK